MFYRKKKVKQEYFKLKHMAVSLLA